MRRTGSLEGKGRARGGGGSLRSCLRVVLFLLMVWQVLSPGALQAAETAFKKVPVKGMVTMVDLGANACIPCKLMAPIMKRVEKAYRGKAAIVFIDVWQHKEQARRFGVRAIPTQIFFDRGGREVYRHVGFMSEKAIIEELAKMGVH